MFNSDVLERAESKIRIDSLFASTSSVGIKKNEKHDLIGIQCLRTME
jgi:hypothetical protein